MGAYDELRERLTAFPSAPFLFMGAGVSRRYLQLDGWVELLTRMAGYTGRPYAYFASKANGDLPTVASEIAAAFHEIWWTDPMFEASRAEFGDRLRTQEGPLKVEIARYTSDAASRMPTGSVLVDELNLLKSVVIDGVITTNYDDLAEQLFADFRVFVGQDEVLFADAQGIGEIYKIMAAHATRSRSWSRAGTMTGSTTATPTSLQSCSRSSSNIPSSSSGTR